MTIVKKGWGREIILMQTKRYCIKVLLMAPSSRMSLHYHKHKDETFIGMGGMAFLESSEPQSLMEYVEPFIAVHITPGQKHSLYTGDRWAVIMEVATSDNPKDSYRIRPGNSQDIPQERWPKIHILDASWAKTLAFLVQTDGRRTPGDEE